MRFRVVGVLCCLTVVWLVGCAQGEQSKPSAAEAFNEMWNHLDQIKVPVDHVLILEQFMADYPDTEQAENALGDVIYYRTEKMDDLPGAIAVTRRTLDQTLDPGLRFKIGLRLHKLKHKAGEPTDLGVVADELASHRELGFLDHLDVVEMSEETGQWDIMLEHATAMVAFANSTSFRAAYPDDDFSDERVEFSVNRRMAWVLAYRGGALVNLGRLEQAEEVFREAADIPAITDFVGIPVTPLDVFRGQAAMLLNRPDEAAEYFAVDALMGWRSDAKRGLEDAYVALNGGMDGYDEYCQALREQIARPLAAVTLINYEGLPVDLSSRAGTVMVISFWNPG